MFNRQLTAIVATVHIPSFGGAWGDQWSLMENTIRVQLTDAKDSTKKGAPSVLLSQRKVRDSNPRYDIMRTPHFECGSFDHSDNFPHASRTKAGAKVLLFSDLCKTQPHFCRNKSDLEAIT